MMQNYMYFFFQQCQTVSLLKKIKLCKTIYEHIVCASSISQLLTSSFQNLFTTVLHTLQRNEDADQLMHSSMYTFKFLIPSKKDFQNFLF